MVLLLVVDVGEVLCSIVSSSVVIWSIVVTVITGVCVACSVVMSTDVWVVSVAPFNESGLIAD